VRLRRCTFRRVVSIRRGTDPRYDVDCLYPDRLAPLPLGDLETARAICNRCTAPGVFRADED
jgi:hypothetical protein